MQRWISKSSPREFLLLPECCNTELAGVSPRRRRSDNAESLFPSDDSDYEEDNNQTIIHDEIGNGRDGDGDIGSNATTVLKSSKAPPTNNNDNKHDDEKDTIGALLSQLPTVPTFENYYDPIEFIADWCSDRFAEQSSSPSSSPSSSSPSSTTSALLLPTISRNNNNNNNLVESYPPGSALDVLSRASSSPYTPLSYQVRTIVRVGLPSLFCAMLATISYPHLVNTLVHLDNDALYTDQVYTVLSNDLSQYVQNILTTSALLFGMLVGQTYFFMYLQQESVFYALFAEVTEAKSLLEQISLLAYGRPDLYASLLSRMEDYIQKDLKLLSVRDPISATSGLMPKDDPLESILYATSVGLPGSLYSTVKSLREARSARCGALQRKLPMLHIYCLRILGSSVLCAFPVCGSGSVALAQNVVVLQGYMFGVLGFSLTLILGVVEELRNSHSCSSSRGVIGGGGGVRGNNNDNRAIFGGYEHHRKKMGAYSVDGILGVMVSGLELELSERLDGKFRGVGLSPSLPTKLYGVETEMDDNSNGDVTGRYRSKREELVGGEQGNDSIFSASLDTRNKWKRAKEWFRRKVFRLKEY